MKMGRAIEQYDRKDGYCPMLGHRVTFAYCRAPGSDLPCRAGCGGTDRDRAENLASGVAIYLAKKLKGSVPTVDQVNDAVEKVLIEMGHARTALTYARYRDRRDRLPLGLDE